MLLLSIFIYKKLINSIYNSLISIFIVLSKNILNLLILMQFKMSKYVLRMSVIDESILF